MAITLKDVITAARDRHPAFAKQRVPDAVLARYNTDQQRTLLSKITFRNPSYLAQVASIAFSQGTTDVGAIGAGSSGGLPGDVDPSSTVLSVGELPIGQAIEIDTDSAATLVSSSLVASATSTTLTATNASWTTNAYVNDVVQIIAGTGEGQVRFILSNTSNALTVAAWATVPDATSLFRIITTGIESSGTAGVVVDFPTTATKSSYLVRLDSSGNPYLDLTTPLTVTFDVGGELPPHKRLLGGTVRFSGTTNSAPLTLTTYAERFSPNGRYAAYIQSGLLYICGGACDWAGVESIDLRYVPEPPALTALTDYFLLPDAAMPTLVARTAYACGYRVSGLPDMPPVDLQSLLAEASEAESAYIAEVTTSKRSSIRRMRSTGW